MPLLQQSGPHQSIAVLNTEQFFFDSLRRHPGGRYDYEGCIMPSAPAMKHARSHFLSAAGGAGNQNTTPCSGHSLQRRADRINCAAIAGEFVILPHASTQRLIFAPQAVSFRGAGHQVEQLIGLKRLFNKIHGAFADRSEEHTSELQSLMRSSYAGICLKKKKN